jgi:hypothetical protein
MFQKVAPINKHTKKPQHNTDDPQRDHNIPFTIRNNFNMQQPLVAFDEITVSLRDATNIPIPAQNDENSQQLRTIQVRHGDQFFVCVHFGKVIGRGPGSYCIEISVYGVESWENGQQSQTWCVDHLEEEGMVQFKSFRLWPVSYDRYIEQEFVMPKPEGKY